jgi:hypothetical protein
MELNHRLYLYKPSGLAQDFLGELVVDNLQVDIKLQDISTVSFRIPKTINGEFNPRINQVLDSYVVELWYGRVQKTGAIDGVDYQKVRFRIYSTPLEFQEEKFLHSYAGYSIESDLEFKQIISWPGIKVQDFFRSITYGNNTQSTLSGSVRTITQQGTFSETGITPAYTISTNTSGVRYITIPTTTLTASDLDIFIYENRRDVATDAESESSLIPFENVNGVESNLFKPGYYILNKNLDNVLSVSIALPDNLFDFDAFTTSQKVFTYSLYDNPISRRISIGINTDNIQPLSDMYINLAQDAAEGEPLVFGIPGGPNYTFTSQEIYTKNGLSLYQILLGHDMDLGVTYQTVFYPKGVIYNDVLYSDGIVPEGILFNSGFYLGTITETIAEKFRSNIEFNNITIYQAVKDIAESFESIAVFDSINKTVSFYAENEYGINNGLILKYGTYLKSVNKEIDSSKIVTSARALGKNNLKITLISPTGKEVWEDYSYFLDDFHIDFETKKTSVLSPLNPNINIAASNVRGIAAIYESDTGYKSRWLDIDVARTLASWQFARDYFHELMSGNLEDEEILFSSEYDHQRYNGLYDIRNRAIELYVKYETEYQNKKASEYKYAYLRDYYQEKYGGNNSTPEDLIRLNYYIGKYNESVEQTIDFKEEFIDPLYADIYDVTVEDSIAQRFSEVLSFLEKRKHFLIDNQPVTQEYFDNFIYPKIRPFVREYVHNDSKIDTEYDLLKSTKIYVDENKEPKVTININVADILAAYEAYDDWDKFKIGDKIYLYFPEFNIDLEAQIREFSVNFDSKTLSLVISTVRNYNRGFGKFILRNIKTLSNVNKNTVQFYQDDTVSNTNQREEVANILNNGINTTTTPVNTGASDTNGNSSTTTGGEGIVSNNIETVDPVTETLTFGSRQKGVRISDGRVLSYKPYVDGENLLFTQEIEVSAENGFVIRKVLNDANKTVQKQVYIDTNGNAVFAGTLEVGSDAYNQVVSLAGAGTTVFKAGSMSELNAIVTANINDLLLVSATFTDTTPEPDRVYIKDDIYRYDLVQTDPTNVYDWVLAADLKTKITGSVGGWTINSEDIFSNNQKIVLHSDSGLITNGDNPYISIGKSSKGYEYNGIFLGFDNLFAKLSIVSDDNHLKWTGTKLSIKGDLELGTTDAFYTASKTTFGSSTAGVFIGYDNADYKLNIGDATKSLKWNGTDLTLTGNLSGSTGRFGSLTNTDYAVYLGDTTTPLEIKQDSTGNQIVYVNSNGNAKFGALEIISGTSIFSGDINTGNVVIDENGVIGYKNLYLKRTDIFFLAADKSINSTLTNLSIFKAGDLITVEGSLNNNFTYTVAGFDGLTNKVTVLENVVNESAGLPISLIGRTKFKLENSGVLSAVDINLESDDGRKTIRIGNLINQELVSTAGYYGFEITNKFGYYLNVTDLAFNGATKKITSTTTDLSVYLPGNRLRVRTPSGSPISTTYTVASVQSANELTVVQDIFTQAAGTAVDLTTAEPYKVSVTEEGFFVTTVNANNPTDYALAIDYNSNRIWAKRLLISDTEDENDSSVLVGQISSSQYGVVTKYGINRAYVTSEGFKLTRMDGTNENSVFSVNTLGQVFATTLQVSGESKLAQWSVDSDAIYFGTKQTTGLAYSAAKSMTFGVFDLGGGDKRPYISTPKFLLDRDGNAFFKGTLSAGIDTTAIDGNYDPSGSAATAKTEAISDANDYTDGEITSAVEDLEEQISAVQDQIDGAISTYFAGGTPLPIITDYTGGTAPSNPQEGETWYNGSIYQIFTQGAWVAGGNDDIDSQTPWPTNDSEAIAQEYLSLLDFYTRHVGDLYYDNDTGYSYRFTKKTVPVTPDDSTNYIWTQISDTAATAALAAASTAQETADGKITIFTANDDTTYGTIVDDNILDGDIFMPTANFTAIGANHTSLNNNFTFTQNDTFVYIFSTKTFSKIQNVENKTSGSVSGWTINATDIKANNNKMTLHSDSNDSGRNPYISIGQTTEGYEENGAFMGIVGETGSGNGVAKLSLKNGDNGLFWNGLTLEIAGTIRQTSIIETSAGNFSTNDSLNYDNNITGGTRSVLYSTVGDTPNPSTSSQFSSSPKVGSVSWTDKVNYSWSATGSMSGTSSTNTFTPTISGSFNSNSSVILTVTYYTTTAKTTILFTKTETITITVTKVGETGATGDTGAAGTNAKTVSLTAASYVITYDAAGETPNPSGNLLLTASQQNFVTPRYIFTIDGIEGSWQTGNTANFAIPSTYFSIPKLMKVDVAEGASSTNPVAFDTITIIAVKPGTDGTNGLPGTDGTSGEPGAAGAAGADAYTIVLTNEAHTLPTTNTGTVTYIGSGTSIVVYKGTTELNGITSGTPIEGQFLVTASGENITASTPTSTGNPVVFGDHSNMTENENTAEITYTINVENLATFTKKQTFSKSVQGDNGAPGEQGPAGPGVVFRGVFSFGNQYFHTSERRDIVLEGSDYYITNSLSNSGDTGTDWGTPSLSNTKWEPFGAQFSSVATDILLAQNATITRGLVIGETSPTNNAFIRSVGKTGLTSGAGFYLRDDGHFNFGDSSAQYMSWDNTTGLLSVVGDIGGNIGQISVGNKVRITQAGVFGLSDTLTDNPGDSTNNFQLLASNGKLIAKSADIEGNITATTGTFAGSLVAAGGTFGSVSISSTGSLTVGTNITINNTDGIKGTNGTSTAFQLSPNGTGSIGGFSYGINSIQAGTTSGNFVGMSPNAGTGSNISFWAGALRDSTNPPTAAQISAAPFRVTNTGSLTATSGKIGNLSILSTPSIGLSTPLEGVTNSGRFAPSVNVENYTGELILRNQEGSFYDKVNTRAGVTVNEERYFNINVYNPLFSPDSTFIPTIEIGTNNVNIFSSTATRTLKIQPHRILRSFSSTEYEYSFPASSGTLSLRSLISPTFTVNSLSPNNYSSFFASPFETNFSVQYLRIRFISGGTTDRTIAEFFIRNAAGQEMPATPTNVSKTATRAPGSNQLTNIIGGTADLEIGAIITGTGIPVNTTIIGFITQGVVMSENATSGGTASVTFERFTTISRDYTWGTGSGTFTNLFTIRQRSFNQNIQIRTNAGGLGTTYTVQIFALHF